MPGQELPQEGQEHIPEALLAALGPIVEQIGSLTERIRQYDRQLEAISKESYPETSLLRQVEGIGPLTALTFVLTLEDPYRFEKSRSVGVPITCIQTLSSTLFLCIVRFRRVKA